jgi:hypothetical protein
MSVSIRAKITRPNTSTVWPFVQFVSDLTANYELLTQCDSYFKGNKETDLEVYVDHYFPTADGFALNKDAVYALIPLWQTEANREAATNYCTANNIVTTFEEINEPDLTGYVPLHLA